MSNRDPICGMTLERESEFATRQHGGQTFHFCSPACVEKFDTDPQRYTQSSRSASKCLGQSRAIPQRLTRCSSAYVPIALVSFGWGR